jgi:3-hydroxyisobutyrate dehydrogenase-like beta-hydroxyacid dehydrogenase
VFTSLPTEEALLQVANGVAGRMRRDAVFIETSTVGPKASAQVARVLAAKGMAYLRAPISGSTALAESGALTTFVSGPRAAFEAARPVLESYTRAQLWLGEGEEARFAKLAVNLMVAVSAGMMGEALALGRKGGIAWPALLDLVGESVVASPLVKYKLEPLRRRDFTPAATNALVMKDLDVLVKAAGEAGVPVPLAEHMQAVYREVIAAGFAQEDFFSIVKKTERDSGLAEPEA